jgi:poly(A) polymerase
MEQVTLPAAEWRTRDGLDRLARALDADTGAARFVGGAVRDTLLGLPVADIDIATRLAPEQVLAQLKAAGIRAVPTGIAHGTVTAVLPDGPVEVTTLRRDVTTDGRHATVAYTDDWREDAARRDFTMNALYADPLTGEVFDYFDGLRDLDAQRVRFIGDPYKRIAEDHLRILRFFRFLARFGDTPDAQGLEACTARANDLMALSRERIADELLKLLIARDAPRVVALMVEHGILLPVLPEITADGVLRMGALAESEASADVAPNAIRRLAALLPPDAAGAELVAARLKLSNAQRKRLAVALAPPAHTTARELAYRTGSQGAEDVLLLAGGIGALQEIRGWEPPRLPLSGGGLVARGLSKGPEVARALRQVEDRWIAEDFPVEARVAAIADDVVAQLLRSPSI